MRLDEEARRVVGNIHNSIDVMERLFEGLLDLSKLEAGVVQTRITPVNVDALFDRLSQYFRPLAVERGLELRLRSDGEWVESDATLLQQVLGNFLANAIRCTPAGGILLAARPRGATVLLEVYDTGIGIAAADLQRIFEEFVQVGNTERDRRKGLGLGLSIARRSAALIGTEIEVSSRVGRGSRFWISQKVAGAPVLAGAPVARPAAEMAHVAWDRTLKLLLIDDDQAVRAALSDLLGRWGVRFDMAADGADALALVRERGPYGLVMADYRLPPPWNGLDLLAAIGAAQPGVGAPGLLVTADFDPGLMEAARAAGVPVLAKPVRPGALREVLGVG